MDPGAGGGALYDLGIYGVDFIRYLTDEEPRLLHAMIHRDRPDGVDVFSHAVFNIAHATATVTASFSTDANFYAVCGEKGAIYARAALAGRSVENTLQIHLLGGDELIEERFPPENPYVNELEYFASCIESGERPSPGGENSLRNLLMVEEIFSRAALV
jgi:predicted dehydrogenase